MGICCQMRQYRKESMCVLSAVVQSCNERVWWLASSHEFFTATALTSRKVYPKRHRILRVMAAEAVQHRDYERAILYRDLADASPAAL